MCISVRPSVMSKTLIYVGEAERNDKKVNVLAYQNSANSFGPNAMILPFPTAQEMGPENIIDTTSFPNFLKNISDASKIYRLSASLGSVTNSRSFAKSAMIIESGSYTVVLAYNADDVPEALAKVPEHKRPEISSQLLSDFSELYVNQPIAVCCWAGNIKAEPLLWWYEPADKDNLFIPTMDAHDGDAPSYLDDVMTDHIISIGSSTRQDHGNKVYYQDTIPDNIRSLLPNIVHGTRLDDFHQNGDMWTKSMIERFPILKRGKFSSKTSYAEFNVNGWE